MSLPIVNYFAVLLSAIMSLGLGFLWMTVLFAKPYGKYMYGVESLRDEDKNVSSQQRDSSFLAIQLYLQQKE